MSNKVLDTLGFKKSKIFLKNFHIQRTFEACLLINQLTSLAEITEIYNDLEKKYFNKVDHREILRIFFDPAKLTNYEIEVIPQTILPEVLKLEIIASPRQLSGLGIQNYKWAQRFFWSELLQKKSSIADDVIAVNSENNVTETSRFNLFFFDPTLNTVITPPLQSGCINGVYRRHVISSGSIMLPERGIKKLIEMDVSLDDCRRFYIYVANSVREVMIANLIHRGT